jgi:E3 ubiquitin-protein ligase makorin
MTGNRYFAASTPGRPYCPFGRDCMYQHLNEDGTPHVFGQGADYYMPVSPFFRPASI